MSTSSSVAIRILAVLVVLGFAGYLWWQSPGTRRGWARSHAEEAFAREWERVSHCLLPELRREDAPASADEVADVVDGCRTRYTRVVDGEWVDPWDQPLRVELRRDPSDTVVGIRVYSVGADGIDDEGEQDDVVLGSHVDAPSSE